jgi:hypothetical protein
MATCDLCLRTRQVLECNVGKRLTPVADAKSKNGFEIWVRHDRRGGEGSKIERAERAN